MKEAELGKGTQFVALTAVPELLLPRHAGVRRA